MKYLMLLKDFFQKFPDEESFIDYFRQIREEVGITDVYKERVLKLTFFSPNITTQNKNENI